MRRPASQKSIEDEEETELLEKDEQVSQGVSECGRACVSEWVIELESFVRNYIAVLVLFFLRSR
jgi:hypothetical protein